ncbi:hypothetical protein D3C81_1423360 [compost metagenome]
MGRLQGKVVGDDVFVHLAQLLLGLQRTGEVQAAQQQRGSATLAAGEVLKELLQHAIEFCEVLGEVEQCAVGICAEADHLRIDVAADVALQVFQASVEHCLQTVVADFRQAKGHAQRLLALVQVQAFEGLVEAGQLVGLAQHQVHRRVGAQALGVFLHARHQLRGKRVTPVAVGRQQFRQADHQHQAVDRCLAALLAQHAQEG